MTPGDPVAAWRLRPRDGEPRALVELVAQFAWRWRIELALGYLLATVTLTILIELGIL